MTQAEKAAKFDAIQKHLWTTAIKGTLGQSVMAAALIRSMDIPGPDGEDPEDA